MIAVNELRIGNWFINTEEGSRIRKTAKEDFEEDFDAYLCAIEPIPLTPEILEKCGFKGNYYPGEDYVSKKGEFYHLLANKQFRIEGYVVKDIQYLHQLQNLYFALAGQEL